MHAHAACMCACSVRACSAGAHISACAVRAVRAGRAVHAVCASVHRSRRASVHHGATVQRITPCNIRVCMLSSMLHHHVPT